jgi:hypothetical protein
VGRLSVSRIRKSPAASDNPGHGFPKEVKMMQTAVLAIGLDPRFADLETISQFTPELIRSYIEAEIARVRQLGFDAKICLIAPGETAEAEIEAALQSGNFSCVVIGAGLRQPPEHLLLFEKTINLVHRLAPDASIAFNSTPADTVQAVQRWVQPSRARS